MEWRDVIRKQKRYQNFTLLDTPENFNQLFANQTIRRVQVHSIAVSGTPDDPDIVGFCGAFQWRGNHLTSLDGDSYAENVRVLGYQWFLDRENRRCLDILVGDDW